MNWLAFLAMAALITWFRYRLAERERLLEHAEAVRSLKTAEVR
jgi:hypothetical protein